MKYFEKLIKLKYYKPSFEQDFFFCNNTTSNHRYINYVLSLKFRNSISEDAYKEVDINHTLYLQINVSLTLPEN